MNERLPLSEFSKDQNTWQAEGTRSDEYGGFSKTSWLFSTTSAKDVQVGVVLVEGNNLTIGQFRTLIIDCWVLLVQVGTVLV